MDSPTPGQAFVKEIRRRLAQCHERIRHCVDQLDEAQLWWRPQSAMNSIANLLLHLAGNLRQWIVSGVGGAPDHRNRPAEFAARDMIPRDELLRTLADAVAESDATLSRLTDAQLLESRRIQGFDETVLSAILDSIPHFNGHTQEIVFLTRLQLGDAYRFAWVPQTKEEGAP